MKTIVMFCLSFVVLQSNGIAQWQKVNTTFKNRIWDLITSDNNLIAAADSGVYYSTDQGMTWVAKNNGLPSPAQNYFTLHTANGVLYTGSNRSGVYKSTDNGETWQKAGTKNGTTVDIISYGSTILAGGQFSLIGFIVVSTDNGVKWTTKDFLPEVTCLTFYNNLLFAGTPEQQLLISSDGGNTWKAKPNFHNGFYSFARQGNRIIGGGSKVVVTDDGFTTWQEYSIENLSSSIFSVSASANIIFAGTSLQGVFISKDGGKTWTAANSGLSNLRYCKVKILGNKVYLAAEDGLYTASLDSFGAATTVAEGNSLQSEGVLQLAPNPAANYVDIHNMRNAALSSMQLYSVMGEELLKIEDISQDSYRLDISSLASGVYYLRTNLGTQLFLKQ